MPTDPRSAVPHPRLPPRARCTVEAGDVPQVRAHLQRLRREGWQVLSVTSDAALCWVVTAERDDT